MKITPIEIRQQTFERVFRGYEKEAVDAFLNSLSKEWDRMLEESQRLKIELEHAEKEINRIKNYEDTLLRALKSTEETRSQIEEEASKEAEKRTTDAATEAQRITQSAQEQAEAALKDAQKKSSMMLIDAESKAKYILDEALGDLKAMERDFKAMDRYKEQITTEYKKFASDTLEKVARFEEKLAKYTLETKFAEIQESLQSVGAIAATEAPSTPVADAPETPVADEIPTVEQIVEEMDPIEAPLPTSAADDIESLIKEVKKGNKKKTDSDDAPTGGGSFFDKI
jgi:cell division initiation protein